MTAPVEPPITPAPVSYPSNGDTSSGSSAIVNGSDTKAQVGQQQQQHEELQYLNMIADIMSRGQVRVS